MSLAVQRSFDDLGTPLYDVTFCVIDLETTGASPNDCGITEVGAVKLRGGECLGTFQTLVNPGRAIPTQITMLTGITQSMVYPAPRIETVLPALLEFVGDAVIVGHNVRFDLSFLHAAYERAGYRRPANPSIDTCALARRLVRDEVPNCKLGTLATRFRLDHRPSHRALDDALATGDLLHVLLERAAGLGVTGLDDLLLLPKIGGHAQAGKLKLTSSLPRSPGVYLFRDHGGRVLYVGKATNLRSRVRSYFSGDTRRKVGQLLRETHTIDHIVCPSPLDAAVREVRLIHELQPRFNRQAKTWSKYAYLKLTLDEAFPRLSVVRTTRDDGAFYLGPLPSTTFAKRVAEAIETVVPLRRCTARLTARSTLREGACAAAQLGVAACPCAGTIDAAGYAAIVARALRGLTGDPELLLAPLRERMHALAAADRFEEAADVRDRAAALAHALRRQRRLDAVRTTGHLVVEIVGQGGARFVDGRLVQAWSGDAVPLPLDAEAVSAPAPLAGGADGLPDRGPHATSGAPVERDLADELFCVASWLDSNASTVRVVHCDRGLSSALPRVASFDPRNAQGRAMAPRDRPERAGHR
jgi:DNA polymerase-3 subunit epsilon